MNGRLQEAYFCGFILFSNNKKKHDMISSSLKITSLSSLDLLIFIHFLVFEM